MLTAAAAADLLKSERQRRSISSVRTFDTSMASARVMHICDKVPILYVGYTSVKKQILKAAREENSNEDPH